MLILACIYLSKKGKSKPLFGYEIWILLLGSGGVTGCGSNEHVAKANRPKGRYISWEENFLL